MERSRSEDTSEESSGLGNDKLGYFQARYRNHLVNDCTFVPTPNIGVWWAFKHSEVDTWESDCTCPQPTFII